jgi:hypothetical protein
MRVLSGSDHDHFTRVPDADRFVKVRLRHQVRRRRVRWPITWLLILEEGLIVQGSRRFAIGLVSLIASCALVVGVGGFVVLDTSAKSSPSLSASELKASKAKGKTMAAVIAASKKRNKKAFNRRLAALKKSSALISVIKLADSRRAKLYLDFFAAASSDKQVSRLVKKTRGKRFSVSGNAAKGKVRLLSRTPGGVNPLDIDCPEGWIAYWAWFVASEMTCVAFGTMVGIALGETGPVAVAGGIFSAAACDGLMGWLSAKFIDFNAPCSRTVSIVTPQPSRSREFVLAA